MDAPAVNEADRASLGFRVHSGWAVAVVVASGRIVERRRIELADGTVPVQPYHAAEPLPFPEAEQLIRRAEEISGRLARREVERLLAFRVCVACVLENSARALPELKAVLASHPLIHTAEGELYREALRRACTHLAIPLVHAKEKEVPSRIPPELRQRIADYGKVIGPPWRADEKLAAAAAYLAEIAFRDALPEARSASEAS
jgi:hypothetical protein